MVMAIVPMYKKVRNVIKMDDGKNTVIATNQIST